MAEPAYYALFEPRPPCLQLETKKGLLIFGDRCGQLLNQNVLRTLASCSTVGRCNASACMRMRVFAVSTGDRVLLRWVS